MADDTKVDFFFYYHPNHLGSTNFVTRMPKHEDEASPRHEMYEHVEYIPFGETWIEEREVLPFGASKSNRYLFTSKEFDQETRLYYYGARYYDPKTSLWLSPDPIIDSYIDGSPNNGVFNHFNLNLYAYTYQNPVKLVDPNGENPDGDNYDDGYEDVDIGKIHSDLKKGGKWLWNNIFKPVLSAIDDENEDETGFTNLEKTILSGGKKLGGKGFNPSFKPSRLGKNAKFDFKHIFDRHKKGGETAKKRGAKNSLFPENMNEKQIKAAVKAGWKNRKKIKSRTDKYGNESILFRGKDKKSGLVIDYWYNKKEDTIKSAYPKKELNK